MKKPALLAALVLSTMIGQSQVVFVIPALMAAMPEHGFLGGKKFTFYPTIQKYNFEGKKIRVELQDIRDSLRLTRIPCASVDINNNSEYRGPEGDTVVAEYFQRLCASSDLILDSSASDTLRVYLQALDSRLIGFGSITAHGLCQIVYTYRGSQHAACTDITDKDPHSPINSNAFVTRKTATRIITSAAIRECIEKILMEINKN